MSKREKLRKKLRNPSAEVDMQDVRTLLEGFGFILIRTRGSHHIFEYDDGRRSEQVVFPLHGRKVKRVYVQEVIAVLDDLFPAEDEADDE